jgi:polyphosphate kinase
MARSSLSDPRYYFNRHESWLAFNRRVLEEALDEGNPLLERVKFIAITANNLDEFVAVRVSGLLQQVEHGNPLTGPDGLSPAEQLQRLASDLHSFVTRNTLAGTSSFFPRCDARASEFYRWRSSTVPAAMPWTCSLPAR